MWGKSTAERGAGVGEVWTILLIVAVAIPVFLLLRWMAAKRALAQAQRMREERGRQGS